MYIHCHSQQNFGDALAPYLYKKFTNKEPVLLPMKDPRPKLIITGSLLEEPNIGRAEVWGAGIAWRNKKLQRPYKCHAVRGPISAEMCVDSGFTPKAYGDPALLLPMVYTPKPTTTHKVSVVPSWVDKEIIEKHFDVNVIDVFDPIEDVIDQITSSEQVYCTCLHGLICAAAYGIRCRWLEVSNNLVGDGTKFNDFLASIKVPGYNPRIAEEAFVHKLDIDLNKLLDSCPFL